MYGDKHVMQSLNRIEIEKQKIENKKLSVPYALPQGSYSLFS